MNFIILYPFIVLLLMGWDEFGHATKFINVERCEDSTFKKMELHTCKNLEFYHKYDMTDAAGQDRITLIPNRLYHSRGYYTAYSSNDTLVIGKKLYTNDQWFELREYYLKLHI